MTDGRGLLVLAAALAGLAAPAVLAWSDLAGGFAVAAVPVAALAALALAGRRPARWAAVGLAGWLVAAPLLAGVPAGQLGPGAWAALPGRLAGGWQQLAVPGGPIAGDDPWPLAAGLLFAGAAWIAAAALARRRPAAALAAGAAPWLAVVLLEGARASVWQGAAVVLAVLAWHAWRRTSARAAVALGVVVALASGVAAQAVAPRHRWLHLPGSPRHAQRVTHLLDVEPTYERLADPPTGAPMLDVRASAPALWRMQALDVFDGRAWRVSADPPRLPEPAAEPARIDVRVRGLLNSSVVSPGAIVGVEGPVDAHPVAGVAWRLAPAPDPGDEYRVNARVVQAGAGELRRARRPLDPRLAAYTRLGWHERRPRRAPGVVRVGPFSFSLPFYAASQPRDFPVDVPLFGHPPDARATAALDRSPYRGVAALARRLAAGAPTEWEVVARVMRHLRDEGRFRYTTHVGRPGPFPLADFLLRTHAGYCQHFAGAAALLLRLAGVPARVVAGFATGRRSGGLYRVRAADAHDWIEVYFAGYGWVPFNPTPAGGPAAVAPGLDLLAPAGGRGPRLDSRACALVALLAAVLLAGRRRRRRRPPGDALARLLPAPVLPSTTLGELAGELARTVGPHTAALAAEAERARFSPQGAVPRRWTGTRIARALVRDVGPWRALLVLARPTTGSAPAGGRASHHRARGPIA